MTRSPVANSCGRPFDRDDRPKMGLLAGWGRFPIVVAGALRRQGYRTYCLGVAGHADPLLAELCDEFRWIGLARLGAAIRYFRRRGVTEATMAGKVHKVVLFQPWVWLRHLPDGRAIRAFYSHFLTTRKDRKDDTLLGTLVTEFAADGITFGPATDYAPELLVRHGQLTRRGPNASQWKDIEFGWQLAKELGRLDVGQSVAVKGRAALALEAVEGTDECIRRAGALCRAGGFTVVKVAKPRQDMRFDVPTIGLGTLETMVAAGGRVLAIEAGRTIVIDEPDLIDYANRNKLVLVALDKNGRLLEESSAGQGSCRADLPSAAPNHPETPRDSRER
ncbi:MAG: LpxI family protein [Pirellulales bacterium]